MLAGQGERVAFPFNLRVLLPWICRDKLSRWWAVWIGSWLVLFTGCAVWAVESGVSAAVAVAVAVAVVALPGVLQPRSTHPVGVDLPAMAVSVWSAAAFVSGWWLAGGLLLLVAVLIKEQSPVWVALWSFSAFPLVFLVIPVLVWLYRRPVIDRVTGTPLLRRVHDHPVRSAWEHHIRHGYRDGWIMVAPWGIGLAALLDPTPQLIAALAVGYGSLLVATDTVRVYTPPAAPVVMLTAAQIIPINWLPLALVLHVFWWRPPATG